MGLTSIISVLLIIIIFGGLYYTYYYFNPMLLNNGDLIDLNNKSREGKKRVIIGTTEFEEPKAIRYFYDGWFRVNATEDLQKTYVLFDRGPDFIVTLTGHKLSIMHSYYPSDRTKSTDGTIVATKGISNTGILQEPTSGKKHTTIMDIATQFPFQKWVYLCINVDENTIDAYLNGKLAKSVSEIKDANASATIIKMTDANPGQPITIGTIGVSGKIARFRREARLMDPQSVWNVYIQGPGVTDQDDNGTGDYHAKLQLTRNNLVRRKYNIF